MEADSQRIHNRHTNTGIHALTKIMRKRQKIIGKFAENGLFSQNVLKMRIVLSKWM